MADKTVSCPWSLCHSQPLPCPQTAGVLGGSACQSHRNRSHSPEITAAPPTSARAGGRHLCLAGPQAGEGSWGSVSAPAPSSPPGRVRGGFWGAGLDWVFLAVPSAGSGSLGKGSIRVLLCMLFCKYLLGTLIYSKNIFHNVCLSLVMKACGGVKFVWACARCRRRSERVLGGPQALPLS